MQNFGVTLATNLMSMNLPPTYMTMSDYRHNPQFRDSELRGFWWPYFKEIGRQAGWMSAFAATVAQPT